MSYLLRFRSLFITVVLLSCACSGTLHAQAHQWVYLNGIFSGGVTQIVPTAKRTYFVGSSIVSFSPSEGWRPFWYGVGADYPPLIAPDGRIIAYDTMISGDPPHSQALPLKKMQFPYIYAIDSSGGLYASGGTGIGHSHDWLTGWTFHVDSLYKYGPEIQVAKTGEVLTIGYVGIQISQDSGSTWTTSAATAEGPFHELDVSNRYVWFAYYGGNTHLSRDRGKTWQVDSLSPYNGSYPNWRSDAEGYGINNWGNTYVTKDTAKTWQLIPGIPVNSVLGVTRDTLYAYSNGTLFTKSYDDTTIHSLTFGTLPPAYRYGPITSLFHNSLTGTLCATQQQALFRSTDDGLSWTRGKTINSVAGSNPILLGTSHGMFLYAYGGVPMRSTDDGITWKRTTGWIGDTNIVSMTQLLSGDLFAVNGAAIYRSTDGVTWGLTDETNNFVAIGSDPTGRLYAATNEQTFLNLGAIYRSTDVGTHWEKLSPQLSTPQSIRADYQNVYVACDNGLFRSTDQGDTWTFFDSTKIENVLDAVPIGTNSCATITDNHLKLYPSGADTIEEATPEIQCMFSDPQSHIMYIGGASGIERSTTPVYYGPLRVASASSLPDNDIVTVNAHSIVVRYDLTEPEDVQLTLRDILGRSAGQLQLGEQGAGSHEASLETSALPRGTYFLEITKGERTAVHSVGMYR